jgi:hypothetical protein
MHFGCGMFGAKQDYIMQAYVHNPRDADNMSSLLLHLISGPSQGRWN